MLGGARGRILATLSAMARRPKISGEPPRNDENDRRSETSRTPQKRVSFVHRKVTATSVSRSLGQVHADVLHRVQAALRGGSTCERTTVSLDLEDGAHHRHGDRASLRTSEFPSCAASKRPHEGWCRDSRTNARRPQASVKAPPGSSAGGPSAGSIEQLYSGNSAEFANVEAMTVRSR